MSTSNSGNQQQQENSEELRRTFGPALLSIYGAGTILGAGIFVLVEKVAGTSGYYTPLAFLIAALVGAIRMGERKGIPDFFAQINKLTSTPLLATIISPGVCIMLALFIPLKTLASITSTIMLLVFIASNAALIVLERRKPQAPFDTPRWMPWVALVLCVALVASNFLISGGGH